MQPNDPAIEVHGEFPALSDGQMLVVRRSSLIQQAASIQQQINALTAQRRAILAEAGEIAKIMRMPDTEPRKIGG